MSGNHVSSSEAAESGGTPAWLTGDAAAWAVPGTPPAAEPPVSAPEGTGGSPEPPVAPAADPQTVRSAVEPPEPAAPPAAFWSTDTAESGDGSAPGAPGFSDGGAFADVVRPKLAAPTHGWRAAVYALTAGRWNPGLSEAELRLKDQVRRVTTPLSGPFSVAVGSIKGGVGKTNVYRCARAGDGRVPRGPSHRDRRQSRRGDLG